MGRAEAYQAVVREVDREEAPEDCLGQGFLSPFKCLATKGKLNLAKLSDDGKQQCQVLAAAERAARLESRPLCWEAACLRGSAMLRTRCRTCKRGTEERATGPRTHGRDTEVALVVMRDRIAHSLCNASTTTPS